jgi:hypothetical protein
LAGERPGVGIAERQHGAHADSEQYELPDGIGEAREAAADADYSEEHWQGAAQRCQPVGRAVRGVPAQAPPLGRRPEVVGLARRKGRGQLAAGCQHACEQAQADADSGADRRK